MTYNQAPQGQVSTKYLDIATSTREVKKRIEKQRALRRKEYLKSRDKCLDEHICFACHKPKAPGEFYVYCLACREKRKEERIKRLENPPTTNGSLRYSRPRLRNPETKVPVEAQVQVAPTPTPTSTPSHETLNAIYEALTVIKTQMTNPSITDDNELLTLATESENILIALYKAIGQRLFNTILDQLP